MTEESAELLTQTEVKNKGGNQGGLIVDKLWKWVKIFLPSFFSVPAGLSLLSG